MHEVKEHRRYRRRIDTVEGPLGNPLVGKVGTRAGGGTGCGRLQAVVQGPFEDGVGSEGYRLRDERDGDCLGDGEAALADGREEETREEEEREENEGGGEDGLGKGEEPAAQ